MAARTPLSRDCTMNNAFAAIIPPRAALAALECTANYSDSYEITHGWIHLLPAATGGMLVCGTDRFTLYVEHASDVLLPAPLCVFLPRPLVTALRTECDAGSDLLVEIDPEIETRALENIPCCIRLAHDHDPLNSPLTVHSWCRSHVPEGIARTLELVRASPVGPVTSVDPLLLQPLLRAAIVHGPDRAWAASQSAGTVVVRWLDHPAIGLIAPLPRDEPTEIDLPDWTLPRSDGVQTA